MANLVFEGGMAPIQHGFAQCHDAIMRRSVVLETLNLRSGERVLEQGCGGGFYTYEIARFVGPQGRVAAIDISVDQVTAARERCREMSWVECQIANASELPYGDATFDAVFGVQVLEYIQDFEKALREAHRVLRLGGRFLNLATNWTSLVWHSEYPERMRRVLEALATHAPYPDLPVILAPALRRSGFQFLRQQAAPIVNTSYNENRSSFWIARLTANFARGPGTVKDQEIDEWLAEFPALEAKGEFFFSTTTVLTEAIKLSQFFLRMRSNASRPSSIESRIVMAHNERSRNEGQSGISGGKARAARACGLSFGGRDYAPQPKPSRLHRPPHPYASRCAEVADAAGRHRCRRNSAPGGVARAQRGDRH